MRESKICPTTNLPNIAVRVKIEGLSGVKLTEAQSETQISFDVKARMEERERRSGWVVVGFALFVGTKPSVVKFEVRGIATIQGKDESVKKMLEPDPETQIPLLFQSVYQHSFMSIYLLATLIDCPYPPPNLLGAPQLEGSPIYAESSIRDSDPTAVEGKESLVNPENGMPNTASTVAVQAEPSTLTEEASNPDHQIRQ